MIAKIAATARTRLLTSKSTDIAASLKFKLAEAGIIKEDATCPDMEEAQDA